jgi:hypothetical protein
VGKYRPFSDAFNVVQYSDGKLGSKGRTRIACDKSIRGYWRRSWGSIATKECLPQSWLRQKSHSQLNFVGSKRGSTHGRSHEQLPRQVQRREKGFEPEMQVTLF